MDIQRADHRVRILITVITTFFMYISGAGLCLTALRSQSQAGNVAVAGQDVTILVTVHPHNDRTRALAEKLQPADFVVREKKIPQRVLAAKRSTEVPPTLAVLIQDDLVSHVNNEIRGIKDFIRQLPEGSRILTAYLTAGSLSIAQDFSTDRERAADSLRIVRSSPAGTPSFPYIEVIDAIRRFDSQLTGRRMILLISDGLDVSRGFRSASPGQSIDLERAIAEAQRRGIVVFSFYSPSIGLTSMNWLALNFGQGSLIRLADETGGMAFFSGTDFVTFDPYFKEFRELLGREWLITYRSTNTGSGFRRIEVKTEEDVHLHYPSGYQVKDKKSARQ